MTKSTLAEEHISPQEESVLRSMLTLLQNKLLLDNPAGLMRRDVHVKMHGLVKAEFVVETNLPAELRVGVFTEPKTFQAWIRFSNADPRVKPDIARDVRGMAIKVMGVPGEKLIAAEKDETTQDFILINTSVFVTKDVAEFEGLVRGLVGGFLKLGWFMLTHFRTAWLLLNAMTRIANPLQVRYFSTTPYLFGSHAVKYSAIPHVDNPSRISEQIADDYLRQALENQLREGPAYFDFAVQIQTDAALMPIEDPRCDWPQAVSPFHKLATIRILQQECGSEGQRRYGENMSFSPWHALAEHRPLGGINRARRVIYETISKFRHQRNGAPRNEPTGWDIPSA